MIKIKGFTLVEILIVIAIIALLAGITFVLINPRQHYLEAQDDEREADVNRILNKVHAYLIDNKTITDLETLSGSISECSVGYSNIGTSSVNLAAALVPSYIDSMPEDPSESCDEVDTCYDICKDTATNRIQINAPNASARNVEVIK